MTEANAPECVLLRDAVPLEDVRVLADGHGWSLLFEIPRSHDVLAARRWQTADGTAATYVEDHVSGIRYISVGGPDQAGIAEFIRSSLPHHTTAQLFTSLAELQQYDTVVLANVPRASGDDAANVGGFSDEQILMLVRNTEMMGSGLVMLGGPNSFGAGGWTNTELEKAMPVDFTIKSA